MSASAARALAARYGLATASAPAPERPGQSGPHPLAGDPPDLLPVAPPLAPLLTAGGLRRGSVVRVAGSTSLALALLAEASAGGNWSAVVGVPGLGAAAVAESGIALDRFVRVPQPGPDWAAVVAVLLDAVDLVVVRPSAALPPARSRRLAGRVRERRAVLVVLGPWEGADVGLTVTDQSWQGLGDGYGRLRARQVQVRAQGRGAAARTRQVRLWLPGADGRVTATVAEAA